MNRKYASHHWKIQVQEKDIKLLMIMWKKIQWKFSCHYYLLLFNYLQMADIIYYENDKDRSTSTFRAFILLLRNIMTRYAIRYQMDSCYSLVP